MNSAAAQTVVDVGAGKSSPFANYRDLAQKARIIAVDVSEEQLKHNTDVDEKRTSNIAQTLPFGPEEVDIIASSSVLEHLENLDGFMASSKQTLRGGGYFIHLFPSKFAPFALINQVLPRDLSRKVLYLLRPGSIGIGGFPAFYKDCYYSRINKRLKEHDFDIVDVHLSYYQSHYFSFFTPLFLVSALYEILVQRLGAKDLCAYVLVIAQKKSGNVTKPL
jgi:SAM-dependent methyltransferase